ncbi:tetratricopeptide repeat domain 35 [Trametopsis cervina]|nr:tetratricopeptide repeat domain 35 [Trametopsis cervina]
MAEVTSILQRLGGYQPRSSIKSQTLVKNAPGVLAGGNRSRSDEGWDAVENTLLAAVDEGDYKLAEKCLELLVEKFPASPRVDCLSGIIIESKESPATALAYYDELLKEDSSNAALWRRKAGVLRRSGKVDEAATELCVMLDTFYTEVEGWLELTDIYLSCNRNELALQALSHVLLLAPQNPFHVLHFAETAFLVPDIPLALKVYLQVVDMTDDDDQDGVSPMDTVPSGLALRAWYGVKLCTNKLITEPRAINSPSQVSSPKTNDLAALDDLATERLKTAYLETTRESPPAGDSALLKEMASILLRA